MPAKKLKKLENEGKTVEEQAQILGVSVAAVKKRRERLSKAPEQGRPTAAPSSSKLAQRTFPTKTFL